MRRRFFRIALGLAGLHAMAVGAHAQTAVQPAVPCALEYAPLTLGAPVAEGSADDLPDGDLLLSKRQLALSNRRLRP